MWVWLRNSIAGFAAVAFFMLLAFAGQTQAQAKQGKSSSKTGARPNIVLVQTDDAISGDIRFLPNVKRLLERGGTTLSNNIVPYPLCGPARASLLTGQLAHNHQVVSNFRSNDGGHLTFRDLPGKLNQRNSLAPWLRQSGYRTAMVGKYMNEYGVFDQTEIPPGWDRWVGMLDNSTYDYFNYGLNVNGKVQFRGERAYAEKHMLLAKTAAENPPMSFGDLLNTFQTVYDPFDYFGTQVEKNYSMDVTGGYASRFVRNAAPRKKPFFLYYAPPGPHAEDTNHIQGLRPGAPLPDPRPPARYADTFDNVELPRPPSFNEADVSDKASNLSSQPLLTEEKIGEITDNYRGRLGALRAVDDQVGRIAKELRRAGELKNTFIIFTSDNGYLQGEHRLRSSKFLPYENSVKVPALIRGPGIKAGRSLTGTTLDVDMTATVLDMANVKPRRKLDGISVLPAAKGKKRLPTRVAPIEALRPLLRFFTPLTAFDVPYYGLRTSQYKYIN